MGRILVSLVALSVTFLPGSTTAIADPSNDAVYVGGCEMQGVDDWSHQFANPDVYTGLLVGVVAAYSPTPNHNPVAVAELTCLVKVNAVTQWKTSPLSTSYLGPVAVVSEPFQITAPIGSEVVVCTVVTTVDNEGHVRTSESCVPAAPVRTIPIINEALCPLLRSVAPVVVGGLVAIQSDGDVYILGGRYEDCP